MKESHHLPDRLTAGLTIRTKTGHEVTIVTTSKRDKFDQPLYRLKHPRGTIGHGLFSRDALDAEGCTVVEDEPVQATFHLSARSIEQGWQDDKRYYQSGRSQNSYQVA